MSRDVTLRIERAIPVSHLLSVAIAMSVPTEHPEYPRPADFQVEIYKQGQEGMRPRYPLNSEE